VRIFRFFILPFYIFFGSNSVYAQIGTLQDINYLTNRCYVNVLISGKIFDKSTREPLAYASIGIKGTTLNCIADSGGHYVLNILPILDTVKTFDLVGTYISYKPKVVTIKERISKDVNIDLALEPSGGIICFPDPPALTKKQIHKLKREQNRTKKNE
jgi:hypothetical protein